MRYTTTLREIDTDAIIRLKFHRKDLTYQQYHRRLLRRRHKEV